MRNHFRAGHEIWCTVSGDSLPQIESQLSALLACGVHAIEFRLDLIPEGLWEAVVSFERLPRPWWVAHFGTARQGDANSAMKALRLSMKSEAAGCICHSRLHDLSSIRQECEDVGKSFAAPYHSQRPLTRAEAEAEYAYQETLSPAFRKIAVRALSPADALAMLEATLTASGDGGSPVVGAVFGTQRWARGSLPSVGSAITFIVAEKVDNEAGGDDEQLRIEELQQLLDIRGLWPRCRHREPIVNWRLEPRPVA